MVFSFHLRVQSGSQIVRWVGDVIDIPPAVEPRTHALLQYVHYVHSSSNIENQALLYRGASPKSAFHGLSKLIRIAGLDGGYLTSKKGF